MSVISVYPLHSSLTQTQFVIILQLSEQLFLDRGKNLINILCGSDPLVCHWDTVNNVNFLGADRRGGPFTQHLADEPAEIGDGITASRDEGIHIWSTLGKTTEPGVKLHGDFFSLFLQPISLVKGHIRGGSFLQLQSDGFSVPS